MDSMPRPTHHAQSNPRKYTGRFADFELMAQEKVRERRARVLAHSDIAKRLTESPLNYPTPDMWNGYVPPAEVPTINGWKRNESIRRRALVLILNAVRDRENQLGIDAGEESA